MAAATSSAAVASLSLNCWAVAAAVSGGGAAGIAAAIVAQAVGCHAPPAGGLDGAAGWRRRLGRGHMASAECRSPFATPQNRPRGEERGGPPHAVGRAW